MERRSTDPAPHTPPSSSGQDHRVTSIELENGRQRSTSVNAGEQNTPDRLGAEPLRRSSLGSQSQRSPFGSQMRRSMFQGYGRPNSCSRSRAPPTGDAAPEPFSAQRSQASSVSNPRAESPYQGATGPSHPYAMYSQDTNISRATSTATASTVRWPARLYLGPREPNQPYGIFPQNTVSEHDQDPFNDSSYAARVAYPPGARTAPQAHQRRLGPEGEDVDDLIGPYGYAEQLPPYTRYPNDIPPKRDPDASSFVNGNTSNPEPNTDPNPSTNTSTDNVPRADHNSCSTTLPTPLAYPNAPTQQPLDLTIDPHRAVEGPPPHQPQSVNSPLGAGEATVVPPRSNRFSDTSTQGSPAAVVSTMDSEKGSFEKRARRLRKKRICWGVLPCWLLPALVVFCLAVLLGGIIGGVLAHKEGVRTGAHKALQTAAPPLPSDFSTMVPTTTVTSIIPAQTPDDAAPLASTPTSLPALPTGSFSLTLEEAWTTTNSCLTDATQNNAWDCSNGAKLNITIQMEANAPYIALTCPQQPGQPIRYGAQPPQLNGASTLLYMRDKSKSAVKRGPAYAFTQPFEKAVIVRSADFPGAIAKRGLHWSIKPWLGLASESLVVSEPLSKRGSQQSDWNMTNYATQNDKPWLCTWKGTLLSGFIYDSQDIDEEAQSAKLLKLTEKRPWNNRVPAYCQQMQIGSDWQMTPHKRPDGSHNEVKLREAEFDPAGGPRCECAWQST